MRTFHSLFLCLTAISASLTAGARDLSVGGDLRNFGIENTDTIISLNCGELATDKFDNLTFADYRNGFDISLDVRFKTFLTEQAALCREGKNGNPFGSLTIGYDPGSEQIFAEVVTASGKPERIMAGPKVTDSREYSVRVNSTSSPAAPESQSTSILKLTVFPKENPVDSIMDANNSILRYAGYALPYHPGRWILGHGFPNGFPNSLQLRNGEISNVKIKGMGREHIKGTNPLFPEHFTADPAALVTNGRLYLYAGEDKATPGGWFSMPHWIAYSTEDMINWECHGPVLKAADFPHANPNGAWAAQVVEKDGKYYFYVTLDDTRNGEHMIDVAVGDTPLGPFTPIRRSTPLITDNMTASHRNNADIDPTVMIDDDGSAWIAWGNGDCYLAKLKDNMIELDGEIIHLGLRNYSEGPWLFKRNGLYYNVYAADAPGVQPEQLAYSYATSVTGPWTYGGLLTGPARYGFTIHPSVNEFKGNWYLFYHDGCYPLTLREDSTGTDTTGTKIAGGDCRRHVCVERLDFDSEGRIIPITLTHDGLLRP